MSIIDDLLQKTGSPQKEALQHVRSIVNDVAPDAEEVMTYGMPGYKYKGKYLISFAAFKDHMSIFPGSEAVEALRGELDGHKLSKGTVQFTVDKPIPDEVIKKIILYRIADISKN
jgi:uncharacterized protein YdhG (YjbR/CyaY superfamily)